MTFELLDVRLQSLENIVERLTLRVRMSAENYAGVDRDAAFHLETENRGPSFGGEFQPTGPVEMEMALEGGLLPTVSGFQDRPTELFDYFGKLSVKDPQNVLLDSDYWYAQNVTEEDIQTPAGGSTRTGYQTRWARLHQEDVLTKSLGDEIESWLRNENWTPERLSERELSIWFSREDRRWPIMIHLDLSGPLVVLHSLPPFSVPTERLVSVAEFITRANFGIPVGNFELNWGDGEIRFKTSTMLPQKEQIPELVGEALRANILWMDRYYSGLLAVIRDELTAQQATDRDDKLAGGQDADPSS